MRRQLILSSRGEIAAEADATRRASQLDARVSPGPLRRATSRILGSSHPCRTMAAPVRQIEREPLAGRCVDCFLECRVVDGLNCRGE